MHLFGFIKRIYHDARSPERQSMFCSILLPSNLEKLLTLIEI